MSDRTPPDDAAMTQDENPSADIIPFRRPRCAFETCPCPDRCMLDLECQIPRNGFLVEVEELAS